MSSATLAMPDLFTMGASEMAEAIRKGEITPLEIVTALLERISAHDGKIRAFSHLERETVLIEAEALTEEAKAGKFRGPFHGVPFGAKEQFAVKDVPSLGDWSDPKPDISTYDATVVEKLREAGALLMGKLFMVGPAGTPPSRNPWNIAHTPGGSSSGSGAAVGARFLPFALSEQTGGSGIRPAAYCGISGLKPTYGRNSRYGMFPMVYSQDHACIIATTIEEVENVFAVTAGYDPKDISTVADGEFKGSMRLSAPPKIGVVRNFFPELTDPEMNAAIDIAAGKLAAAGAEVVDFYLPAEFETVWANAAMVSLVEGGVINAKDEEQRKAKGLAPRSSYPPAVETRAKFGMFPKSFAPFIPATYYLQAQRYRRYLRDTTNASMAGFDAILMATAPGEAPANPLISGDASLLTPWSHLGNPAISIPAPTLSANGMPLGLQFVSATMTDEALLGVGAWCQDVLGILDIPALP